MPTNRKRMRRIAQSKIPKEISEKYREKLRFKDFAGKLQENEIPVAQKAGVHRWDLWKKAGTVRTLTAGQHHNNIRLAPVFNGFGEIDKQRYNENVIFLILNYDRLKEATEVVAG